jgi:hypothetical protein
MLVDFYRLCLRLYVNIEGYPERINDLLVNEVSNFKWHCSIIFKTYKPSYRPFPHKLNTLQLLEGQN